MAGWWTRSRDLRRHGEHGRDRDRAVLPSARAAATTAVPSGPVRLTAGERRRSLAAAIASIAVFGLGVGEGLPLLSLLLEFRATDATLNGLNAAATFVGVILGPLLAPRMVRRLGIRDFLLVCLALDIAVFMLLKPFDSIAAWFPLRVLLGMIGSSIFTTSEAWINLLAGDARRGRIIGLYAAALSAGFAFGPLLLSITGIQGWAPFIANGAISAAAALPLLAVGNLAHGLGREASASPLGIFARAPFVVFVVATFGLFEAALMTLLPIWSARAGLSAASAAATLSAVYFGAIALQVPIGWLSDHLARRTVLRLCGAAGLSGAIVLSVVGTSLPALFALLFVWGGLASGIYPVALAMAAERFEGAALVSANAAIIMAYGVGSLVGPALGGAAMDLWDPHGLPAFFAALFAVFLVATGRG
jgi:MFS family permease